MFLAHGGRYYGCPVGTCSWIVHSSCLWAEDVNGDEDGDSDASIEMRPDDGVECTVTSLAGESPLCTVCHFVLERLRRPRDFVTTSSSPEERSALGCHLCALFLRYTERCSELGQEEALPDHYVRYEYDSMDLDQANLFMLRYRRDLPYVGHEWLTQSASGCVPSAGEQELDW